MFFCKKNFFFFEFLRNVHEVVCVHFFWIESHSNCVQDFLKHETPSLVQGSHFYFWAIFGLWCKKRHFGPKNVVFWPKNGVFDPFFASKKEVFSSLKIDLFRDSIQKVHTYINFSQQNAPFGRTHVSVYLNLSFQSSLLGATAEISLLDAFHRAPRPLCCL